MTLTIDLPPGMEKRLRSMADKEGLPVEKFVIGLIRKNVIPPAPGGNSHFETATPEEWKKLTDEWLKDLDRTTPILSDEALRRENLYEDRGL